MRFHEILRLLIAGLILWNAALAATGAPRTCFHADPSPLESEGHPLCEAYLCLDAQLPSDDLAATFGSKPKPAATQHTLEKWYSGARSPRPLFKCAAPPPLRGPPGSEPTVRLVAACIIRIC